MKKVSLLIVNLCVIILVSIINMPLSTCMPQNVDNIIKPRSVQINSFDSDCDKLIVDELRLMAYNKEETMIININDDIDYDFAMKMLFYEAPHKFLYCLKEANESLKDGCSIKTNETSFVEQRINNSVVINLVYE